jgi:hypothetical protein
MHIWPSLPRFQGVKQEVIGEGTHFMIPWVQRPILFDIRAKPKNVPTITGSSTLLLVFVLDQDRYGSGLILALTGFGSELGLRV